MPIGEAAGAPASGLSHAAQEQYLATEEARRSVHISLVAEVGNSYLTLLADRALL
ncbi:hypothetical protein G3N57_20500, partial [Paraburkholderia sp. Se-20369]|nr:hypothetical protein [Paraburkholderia sp. Se-20369]